MSDETDFFKQLQELSDNETRKWPPLWIVTFSDMLMLLLTFFIFFYSVTTLNKLPDILKYLQEEADVIIPIDRREFPVPQKVALVDKEYLKREKDVFESFRKFLKESGLAKDIKIRATGKEIKITIATPILFDTGDAKLKPRALPLLEKLSELFKNNDNYIRVEGHTDNMPINTEKYPSNWELSSARAISVIKAFVNNFMITPTRFEALGYGEYKPAAKNDTKAGRARNRRVEIKIIKGDRGK